MNKESIQVLIIGGGLTGLTLAHLFEQKGIHYQVLEARERLGGRIFTHSYRESKPMEMGATWLGKKHIYLVQLLKKLGIGIFEQVLGQRAIYEAISTSPPQLVSLPPNDTPSFRIKGGSYSMIDALLEGLSPDSIHTNQIVQAIRQTEEGFHVKTQKSNFKANYVVSTLPPSLLVNTIDIQPTLPPPMVALAQQTHTWMGESIKIGLTYSEPFWRKNNSSGTIVSNVGPIPEMYDHSNYEDSFFALKGFLNGAYFSVSKNERLEMILRQLRKYYGNKADDYLSYDEAVWRKEPFTFHPYNQHILPHQNNGHQLFRQSFLDGKFFIGGSETAADFPGYMDGAVQSAEWISQQIVNH